MLRKKLCVGMSPFRCFRTNCAIQLVSRVAVCGSLFLAFATFTWPLRAEPYPVEWIRRIDLGGHSYTLDLKIDLFGNPVAVGFALDNGFVQKLTPNGDVLWTTQPTQRCGFESVTLNNSGSVLAGGSHSPDPSSTQVDSCLTTLSPNGQEEDFLKLAGPQLEFISSVVVDQAANLFIAENLSTNTNPPPFPGFRVRMYDSHGVEQWNYVEGVTSEAFADQLVVGRDESVYLLSYADGIQTVSELDANGAVLATLTPKSPAPRIFSADAIDVDKEGGIYLGGEIRDSIHAASTANWAVQKYSAAGQLEWTVEYPSPYRDGIGDVAVDRFGNTFVTGIVADANYEFDTFVAKISSGGRLEWQQFFAGPHTNYGDTIEVDALGNVYVGGYTLGDLGGPPSDVPKAYVAKFASGLTMCDAVSLLDWNGTGDNRVDLADLLAVRNNFGSRGMYLDGDADGNFVVDLHDLNHVRSCFAPIPEPSSLILLAVGAVGIVARRRMARP